MLARVLAVAPCLSVSVSVLQSQVGVLSRGIKRIDVVFGMGSSFVSGVELL